MKFPIPVLLLLALGLLCFPDTAWGSSECEKKLKRTDCKDRAEADADAASSDLEVQDIYCESLGKFFDCYMAAAPECEDFMRQEIVHAVEDKNTQFMGEDVQPKDCPAYKDLAEETKR